MRIAHAADGRAAGRTEALGAVEAGCEVPRIASLAAQLHVLDARPARRGAG